ncbi:MAG: hypothetical protein CMJ84_00915 [Planctomycetes bacterium]|jgi:rod shape determining protein RodA|nr:hypothetical protein [Planctomycetota bacterium]MDP6408563.1 FtsW/RodA/SpoVE family cell cycle protein [Planctomycetota bacterium]
MKSLPLRRGGGASVGRGPLFLARLRWREFDWHILLVAFALLVFGLLFLNAMTLADGDQGRDDVRIDAHLKKLAVGLPFLIAGLLVRARTLRHNAAYLYAAAIALLVAVPFVGDVRNNAQRWIETPVFDIQPSEFAKLALILVLARVLERNRLERWRDWGRPLFLAALPMGLVVLQPDLGTALTIVPVTLGMLHLAGARGRVLGGFLMLVALTGFGAWRWDVGFQGYQTERIETWKESFDADSLIEGRRGAAFHQYHARVAIGNGGLLGQGLGSGIANRTGILPERDSDSVFAVICEEGGLVGAGALVLLYLLLIVLLMASAAGLRDRFARLTVGGVGLYFAAHLFFHTGVNLGLLPMTGLTLPLLSTGGSSMLVTFLALGIALGLGASHEPALDRDAFRSY